MKLKQSDASIERSGFSIVNNPARRFKRRSQPVSEPLKHMATTSCRLTVHYLNRRGEVLITSTCARGNQIAGHEAFQFSLGRMLKDLGITLQDCKDALVKQKIEAQTVDLEDEEVSEVVH